MPSSFLTEKEWRLEHLPQALAPWRGKRLALYGSGINAREALERHEALLADALVVDDAHVGEELAGRRVLSLEQALDVGAEVLVIAARMVSIEPVYQRISAACMARCVEVIDFYGADERALHEELAQPRTYTWEQLFAQVDACDVLCVSYAAQPPYLCEIPQAPAAGSPAGSSEAALGMVLHALVAGKPVCQLADWGWDCARWVARELGSEAAQLLERCTPEVCGVVQGNGLFRVVMDRHPGARILHVGTRAEEDFLAPRRYGLAACLLAADVDVPAHTVQTSWDKVRSLAQSAQDQALLELVESRAGASAHEGQPGVQEFAWCVMGPIVAGFLAWLRASLAAEPADAVLFAARDGYVVQKAYDWWRAHGAAELPPSQYLYVSRKAAMLPFVDELAAQDYLFSYCYGMEPRDVLRTVFDLDEAQIVAPVAGDDPDAWLRANAAALRRKAQAERTGLRAYLAASGVRPEGRYRYVDYSGSGTSQRLLERFGGLSFVGSYFSVRSAGFAPGTRIEALFSSAQRLMATSILSTETLMSAPHGSLAGFAEDGTPRLAPETRPAHDLEKLVAAHEQILAFCRAWLPAHGHELPNPELLDALLGHFGPDALDLQRENSWKGVAMDETGHEDTVPLAPENGRA